MDEGGARQREFFAQADELLDALFADLRALRAAAGSPGRARRALLDRLFRHAHTLKGSASLLDESDAPAPNAVALLAHELEDLLEAARARRVALDDAALDACEDAADALSHALDVAARGTPPPPAPPALLLRLRQLARPAAADESKPESADRTPEIANPKSENSDRKSEAPKPRSENPARKSQAPAGKSKTSARRAGVRAPRAETVGEASGVKPRRRSSRAESAAEATRDEATSAEVTSAEVASAEVKRERVTPAGAKHDGAAREGRELDGAAGEARSVPAAVGALPAEIAGALGAAERARVEEAAGEGARLVAVEVSFGLAEVDEKFNRLAAALEASCETLATLPGEPAHTLERISLRLLCATHEGLEELAPRVAPLGASVRTLVEPRAASVDDIEAPPPSADERADTSATGAAEQAAATVAADTVRVPLAELDELAFAADELFDETMAALEASAHANESRDEASARVDAASADAARDEAAGRLRQKFLALAERVLALRMQTLARPLERAARAARAAARASGKEVEVEVAGGSARLDRAVAERIAEPLAHLVRNAVAHGVESPAERRAAGKEARGRVRLAATTEGARVRVSVADDGHGIDLEGVARAAREQGIVAPGARVSEAQALRLIFRPGFSTAARVSQTAGRGVGLDAVEHEIERAGGEVRVRTRAGRGTTFELHLPLALALVPALLVRDAGRVYALDANHVSETGRLAPSAPSASGARAAADWRGRRLPFARLDALLSPTQVGRAPDDDATESLPVVIVRAAAADGEDGAAGGAAEFVVAVDEILGRRDALVRSLGRHATRWRGTTGAIDLRDGSAALMLDLPRLFEVMSDKSKSDE